VKKSGNIRNWSVLTCKIKHVIGLHDVYFVFKGGEGDLFNFDWWKFD
jgi:arabinoxylan arabinofuranohydrolase